MNNEKHFNHKPPHDVIGLAVSGEVSAIDIILKCYAKYIKHLATKKYYDEKGYQHYVIDKTMYDELTTNLIKYILEFKI